MSKLTTPRRETSSQEIAGFLMDCNSQLTDEHAPFDGDIGSGSSMIAGGGLASDFRTRHNVVGRLLGLVTVSINIARSGRLQRCLTVQARAAEPSISNSRRGGQDDTYLSLDPAFSQYHRKGGFYLNRGLTLNRTRYLFSHSESPMTTSGSPPVPVRPSSFARNQSSCTSYRQILSSH